MNLKKPNFLGYCEGVNQQLHLSKSTRYFLVVLSRIISLRNVWRVMFAVTGNHTFRTNHLFCFQTPKPRERNKIEAYLWECQDGFTPRGKLPFEKFRFLSNANDNHLNKYLDAHKHAQISCATVQFSWAEETSIHDIIPSCRSAWGMVDELYFWSWSKY